jgi:hypothetical protein
MHLRKQYRIYLGFEILTAVITKISLLEYNTMQFVEVISEECFNLSGLNNVMSLKIEFFSMFLAQCL